MAAVSLFRGSNMAGMAGYGLVSKACFKELLWKLAIPKCQEVHTFKVPFHFLLKILYVSGRQHVVFTRYVEEILIMSHGNLDS